MEVRGEPVVPSKMDVLFSLSDPGLVAHTIETEGYTRTGRVNADGWSICEKKAAV